MRLSTLLAATLVPITVLSAPVESADISFRQASQFCTKTTPTPSDDEVKTRHDKFADAFLIKKDVKLVFTYIAPEYINHNPMAQNGAQWALNLLGGIWGGQNIIIDRYRWERGYIVEHWDSGERWPAS